MQPCLKPAGDLASFSINQELKRRTRVAGLFPNESSVLRLLTAILIETSDEWETGRSCFSNPSQS